MIQSWNIRENTKNLPQNRGWFMWKFFDENDFFHSEHLELKFSEHKKWETYTGSTTDSYRKTLAILISGKVKFYFGKNREHVFLLENNFDFIADDEIPWEHFLEILEDSTILAIREKF